MSEVSDSFGRGEPAIEDAFPAHHRPRAEPYYDFYLIVDVGGLRRPTDRAVFSELDLFLGAGFVLAPAGEPGDPQRARRHVEKRPIC